MIFFFKRSLSLGIDLNFDCHHSPNHRLNEEIMHSSRKQKPNQTVDKWEPKWKKTKKRKMIWLHTSHNVPEYPTGQIHLNFAIILTHSPPFLHGFTAHSSMSVSQSRPVSKHKWNRTHRNGVHAIKKIKWKREGTI